MSEELLFCPDLDRAIALFSRLGFRLDTIFPADQPAVAALSGHGTRLRLVRAGADDPGDPTDAPALRPSFQLVHGGASTWHTGRAGMQYRDLIPDRQGGRYIASHIRILDGGPVPDYVHFHEIAFQIIYCYRGWVRVVYEDQGEPFAMQPGECVLQPPGIRHRVLEASPGLEVIEIGLPAVHATHVDHDRALPTPTVHADREYGGQRFVRHLPATARFAPAPFDGFDACELGIAGATRGLAGVRVLRARAPGRATYRHGAELLFHVVLRGELTLAVTDERSEPGGGKTDSLPAGAHRLAAGAAFVVPAGQPFTWSDGSADLELLQVALPGEPALERVG